MLRRICLLVNYNQYESKRHFTQQLAQAMMRHEIQVRILDVREQSLDKVALEEIARFSPDLTCSFNSFSLTADKKLLGDIVRIPHWSILVDPAFYSIYLTNSPYSIISSVDQFDVQELQFQGFRNAFFWPHAIEAELPETTDPRIYDVVFIGSCYDYESMLGYCRAHYSAEINEALRDAASLVLSDKNISLSQAFVQAWNHAGLPLDRDLPYRDLLYFLDMYTRGMDRVELIRHVHRAKVHIFGDLLQDQIYCKLGWANYLLGQPNVVLHPPVSYTESLSILQKSKICLNSMPFFKNGSHERVFAGFACGALPLTSRNLYWQEKFVKDEEILFYEHGQWDKVDALIEELLKDETRREAMVSKGRSKVLKQDTWDTRVQQMIHTLPQFMEKM